LFRWLTTATTDDEGKTQNNGDEKFSWHEGLNKKTKRSGAFSFRKRIS
jgi:hypothetical protein